MPKLLHRLAFDHCYINSLPNAPSTSRTHARKVLSRYYKHCIVTKWNSSADYQCAHIVPRRVGLRLGFPTTDSEDNLMFLCGSLHAHFDNMDWAFNVPDPADMLHRTNKGGPFTAQLIARPGVSNSVVSMFENQEFEIPAMNYCSLYLHMMVYRHVLLNPDERSSFDDLYAHYMAEPDFQRCYRASVRKK